MNVTIHVLVCTVSSLLCVHVTFLPPLLPSPSPPTMLSMSGKICYNISFLLVFNKIRKGNSKFEIGIRDISHQSLKVTSVSSIQRLVTTFIRLSHYDLSMVFSKITFIL